MLDMLVLAKRQYKTDVRQRLLNSKTILTVVKAVLWRPTSVDEEDAEDDDKSLVLLLGSCPW